MSFQNLSKIVLIVLCISLSAPAYSVSVKPGIELTTARGKEPAKAADPLERLQQIRDMNKENLSRQEKRALRKELKGIKKALQEKRNGVYLSVGAIIIIILLLILLL